MDDYLILKYIKGQASSEERKQVLDWIETSEANRKYYKDLRNLWDLSLLSDDHSTTGNEEAYKKLRTRMNETNQKTSTRKRLFRITIDFGKIAAAIILTFIISQFIFNRNESKSTGLQSKIEVPTGQRTLVTLPDGTIVWLNSGSKLTYPEKFTNGKRNVILDGEARFNVVHNEKLPFIVETSSYSIRVTGTEFNVYAYNESNIFETTLLNGSILLQKDNDNKNELKMKPNQQASFDKTTGQVTLTNSIDTANIDSWTSGYRNFNKVPLSEMLERLSHYYNREIVLSNPEIGNYECTGKFKNDESLEHILDVIKISKPFRYKTEGNKIFIY